MDEAGDRDRVLPRPVRPQARGSHLGRAPDPAVEDDVDVRTSEHGIDVGRDRRPETDVEPARLAEVEPVLRAS